MQSVPIYKQLWYFVVHLRWHYQIFILSGGYLMGGFFQQQMDWSIFGVQFLNVHLLLFGGATAYNSWWDKDEGAIGGLKHPPEMDRWMWLASWCLQFIGLLIAFSAGLLFSIIYGISMLFFWLYSTPLARWKGKPIKSLVAIGISTGTNSFLMGYIAAGSNLMNLSVLLAACGVGLIILSLYPLSQIYQREEDEKRGDHTFAVHFGTEGVFTFFKYAYGAGIVFLSMALSGRNVLTGSILFVLGTITGFVINHLLTGLSSNAGDYDKVMRIKYVTSLAFVLFLLAGIFLKHLTQTIIF